MLENPVTISTLLFSFRETGLPVSVLSLIFLRRWSWWGYRRESSRQRPLCLPKLSHVSGTVLGTRHGNRQNKDPHLTELTFYRRETDNRHNIVFRWWYILWRNIEQGGETGRSEGRSSKEVREGAMRPSGESGPGCMNSKCKGACLAIPETVGGWSVMRKGRIPRSEVRKAKGQAMQGHLDYLL